MIPFTQDLGAFFATVYGGIFIGVLFDLYRALKNNFSLLKIFSIFYDILFWVFTTLLIFITINVIESFDLRYYHFIALFIGFAIYYNTVSKIVMKFLDKSIGFIKSSINKILLCTRNFLVNLYYVIIYSIHLLFDTIFYIPNLIFKFFYLLKFKMVKIKKSKVKS